MDNSLKLKKIVIIGVGLIGGSLAINLRAEGIATEIVGVGRGLANLEEAKAMGVVDSYTTDIAEAVEGADLVVAAVPVLKVAETIATAAPHLKPGCIVTDVGSVKEELIRQVEPLLPEGVHFVPAHPVAGTESSGVKAALPDLFVDRICILTPTRRTDAGALEVVRNIWLAAGSRVVIMDAATHDMVLAAVSHLPHVIAYTLVNTVADVQDSGVETLVYSAGGFRDFTRIASSSPEMWTDICVMNRDSILKTIEGFQARLSSLKELIENGDMAGMKADFERAKKVRDSLT